MMKKARNWAGGVAAVMLVITLLLVLLFQLFNGARTSSFGPLKEDVLRQIAVIPQVKSSNIADESRLGTTDVHTDPQSESPKTDTETSESGSAGAHSLTSLARPLTRDDLMRLFRPGTNPVENAYEGLLSNALKMKDSFSWATGSDDNGQTALDVGLLALSRGDIDEARNYLRAALDANIRSGDLSLRQNICARLAWAEDDPDAAAALLAASCTAARPIDEEFLSFYMQDALVLSILTGSDALAEHYYAQWDTLEPGAKPIVNLNLERGGWERIESWMEEHHPEFYETATRWDPIQKGEKSGAKSVG